jgi:hypothetical protein
MLSGGSRRLRPAALLIERAGPAGTTPVGDSKHVQPAAASTSAGLLTAINPTPAGRRDSAAVLAALGRSVAEARPGQLASSRSRAWRAAELWQPRPAAAPADGPRLAEHQIDLNAANTVIFSSEHAP